MMHTSIGSPYSFNKDLDPRVLVSWKFQVDRCFGDDETRSETTSSSEKRCLERYEQEILHSLQWKMAEEQKNSSSSSGLSSNDSSRPATSKASSRDKFCCLSREDVIRFLIGVLGALAPLPLTSISSLGIINVD